MDYPSIEEQKEQLQRTNFEVERKHRIVFVGRFFQGATGIVSSLHRALEGLGHTVLPLEPARHKEAFDRSSGAKGGYGPIFFRPETLDAMFKTFQPEVIVFCAGGVVLDTEGAEYFRRQGILTVGLTLSDPDVQESVIDWVDYFDYHATNAQLSFNRYLDEGHTNTFLMPFGIDREYVLRDVPEAPELEADAICIGHATGRPERHEVMTRLAELVDVKVYGEGWPLPSETVAGDKLLQAAHAGTFHVNFPATRAGFTNVKCGAFETVGAGSILCTARFDEMGQLFEYEDEIIGYNNAEDLAEQIVQLKKNPERLESVRRRSFARLLSEHLYEHRWMQLFDNINADLDSENSSKSISEIQRLAGILDRHHGLPRNVIISGFYGARNRGDDLLLDAIAQRLRQHDPDSNVIVAAVNAKEVEATSGYQAFPRSDQHQAEKYASAATATVLGAGGLWHDYTIARAGGVAGIVTGAVVSPAHLVQLPLMTRAYGGDFHVFGMGVGPLTDEAARAVVRLTGAQAKSVTIRDQESLALLDGLTDSWTAKPRTAPDAVYSLELDRRPTELELPDRYIALNVRKWADDPTAHDRIRTRVFEFAEKLGLPVVGVPMQPTDVDALIGEEKEFESSFSVIVPTTTVTEEFLDVIGRAEAVVSMRLHTNLLAHRLGVSAVGFAYDPKVQAHFEELVRDEFVLPLEASAEEIEEAVEKAVEENGLGIETRSLITHLENEAARAMDELALDIANARLQVSPIAGMVHLPAPDKKKGMETDRALDRAIWPKPDGLNFAAATVSSGNSMEPEREVAMLRKTTAVGDQFQLDVRAPKKGDYVEWSLPVDTDSATGRRIELWIKQKYGEKPRFHGYLEYSVYFNDEELFTHDVADWNPRNTVWIAFAPLEEPANIRIKLTALRQCPDWNWGKATSIAIERGRAMDWGATSPLVWGASSPFAIAKTPRESGASEEEVFSNQENIAQKAPEVAAAASPAAPVRVEQDSGLQLHSNVEILPAEAGAHRRPSKLNTVGFRRVINIPLLRSGYAVVTSSFREAVRRFFKG